MFRGTFANKPIHNAASEAWNLARQDGPRPAEFATKANTLWNPLGPEPARGWLVLLNDHLDEFDLNDLQDLVLEYQDQEQTPPKTTSKTGTDTLTLYNLVVTREPVRLASGVGTDINSAYLVEVADARWRCKNPTYSIPINASYNVRQPTLTGSATPTYCPQSLNGGAPWTWQELVTDIWNLMSNQLGTQSQLPFAPTEPPEGWIFQGMPAWDALTAVLARLGCAVKWNPFVANNAHTIVQIGAEDAATDALLAAAENQDRLIHDGDFLPVVRGKIPYGVRVFFHRRDESSPDSCDAATGAAYSIDVDGPDTDDAEPGVYTPIWDDLPAVYVGGVLANLADLTARAQERADDYFRQLRDPGGERLWKIYSGLVAVTPGSTIKAVRWRFTSPVDQDISTEIVNHPFLFYKINDKGQIETMEPVPPVIPAPCPNTGVVVSFLSPPTPTFTVQPLDELCCAWLITLVQPQQRVTIDECGIPRVEAAGVVVQSGTINVCACDEGPSQCITVCECTEFPCGMPCAWAVSYGTLADPDHPWGTLDCGGSSVDFSVFNTQPMLVYWTTACTWVSTTPTGITLVKSTVWQVTLEAGGKTMFYLHSTSAKGDGIFDPCGWNLFLLDPDLSGCTVDSSVPSSIRIDPVGVCGPCPETCECVPGECDECDDNAPWAWDVLIDGCTGPCAVFNGLWHLVQGEINCQWIYQSGTVTITQERSRGEWRVTCTDSSTDAEVSFTANAVGDDCCQILEMDLYVCSCAGGGGDGGAGCSFCTQTPLVMTVEIAGCTGDLADLNGTFRCEYLGDCVWDGIGADLRVGISGGGVLTLQMETATGQGATYQSVALSGNCCDEITVSRQSYVNGATGTAPDNLIFKPSCADGGDDGDCPATCIATPLCCDDDAEEGDCTDCTLCEDGSPDIWFLFSPELADSCCFGTGNNGPLKLFRRDSGDCLWTNENSSRIVSLFREAGQWVIKCITTGGAVKLVYNVVGPPFQCCALNTFRLNIRESLAPEGCDAPTTITIQPGPDGCPCDGVPDFDTTDDDCCGCDASPLNWSMTCAGVTNATCTDCNDYNGTFTLVYTPSVSTCLWCCDNADVVGPCGGPPAPCNIWTLECSGGDWFLTPQMLPPPLTAGPYYFLAGGSWNCLAANTLTLVPGTDGNCNNWPATLTVTPV